jgi:hypothetical protein
VRSLRGARATLVVAVAAQALDGDRPVPLDAVWPRSVAELGAGVRLGVLEPACHGRLHLDRRALAEGRVEPREFAAMGREEASRALADAISWMTPRLGRPATFVAPAWGYSQGTLEAARELELPAWLPPRPGPLLGDGGEIVETLRDGLPGLHSLDYAPVERLAAAGLPPTVVFHGGLLDDRLSRLRATTDVLGAARLALRRDLPRIAALRGVGWVSARELLGALAAHSETALEGAALRLPEGGRAVVRDRRARRLVTGGGLHRLS